eukprot:9596456-Heterocapsa_arctica.AAC.1
MVNFKEAKEAESSANVDLKAAKENLLQIHRLGAAEGRGIKVELSWEGLPEDYKLNPEVLKRMDM